jgi:uncharacterized protein YdgA (DUF945 family)
MNPKLLIGAALSVPLAYLGATAFIGKKTEAGMGEFTKAITDFSPRIKVVKQNYKSGFFTSSDETTFAIGDKISDQVTLRTTIQHGPLPGLNSIGSSRTTTTFVFPAHIQNQLQKLFGDQTPVTIVTTTGFSDGYSASLTSPSARTNIDGATLDWKGLQSRLSKSGPDFQLDLSSEGLTTIDPKGARLQLSGFKLTGNAVPMAGFSDVWLGKSMLSLDSVETSNVNKKDDVTKIGKTIIDTQIDSTTAGFVDQLIKINIASLEIDKESYGSATFNYGLKHLDATALNSISQVFLKSSTALTKSDGSEASTAMAMSQMTEVLKVAGIRIMKNQAFFEVEKIAIAMPAGETKLSGVFKFSSITDDQLQQNPLLLLSKVEASGDLQVSKAGFKQLIAAQQKSAAKKMGIPEDAANRKVTDGASSMEAQLSKLVSAGFAAEKNGIVVSNFVFKEGQLLMNGKSFSTQVFDVLRNGNRP